MNRNAPSRPFSRLVMGMVMVPAALGLAACGKQEASAPALSGAPIAKVAPPAGKTWAETVVVTPEGGYRMGNPDAPIKIIEFASLTCPHCADFSHAAMAELRDNFVASGRVSYEFRNFIRDAIDLTATQLTRCGSPESFFALTDQAFANQKAFFDKAQAAGKAAQEAAFGLDPARRGPAIGELTGLTEFFAARGIAREQANACLADVAKAEALAQQVTKQADQYQITGTPTFIVNGDKKDYNSWPPLKADLEKLGAR